MSYVLLEKITTNGVTEMQTFSEDVFELYSAAEAEAQSEWAKGTELIIGELKLDAEWEKPYCSAQTFGGTHLEPPEYCENYTVRGSEHCSRHGGE